MFSIIDIQALENTTVKKINALNQGAD